MSWRHGIILAFSVWLIYLADRLADAFVRAPEEQETARHAFAADHCQVFAMLVTVLLVMLTVITPLWLSAKEFLAGLGLLGLALGYFWVIHCWPDRPLKAVFPKEAAVGLLFALGSVAFVLCRGGHLTGTLLTGVAGFASVCFLNCALITRWENTERDRADRSSLLNAWRGVLRGLPRAGLATALLALVWSILTRTEILLPLVASTALLVSLDRLRLQLSTNFLRVMADLVLLTPPFFLLLQPS